MRKGLLILNKTVGLIIGIISSYILLSCNHHQIKFIHLDDVLKNYSDSSNQENDIISFIYLKPDLIDTIVLLRPKLLTKRQKESDYFFIDERDKFQIDVHREYSSIEKVIEDLDHQVILSLKKKFSITNPKKDLNKKALIYRNAAFVEFFGSGDVHALTFELKKKNQLIIGLAYITVD